MDVGTTVTLLVGAVLAMIGGFAQSRHERRAQARVDLLRHLSDSINLNLHITSHGLPAHPDLLEDLMAAADTISRIAIIIGRWEYNEVSSLFQEARALRNEQREILKRDGGYSEEDLERLKNHLGMSRVHLALLDDRTHAMLANFTLRWPWRWKNLRGLTLPRLKSRMRRRFSRNSE
jgi:hypothetical protein